MKPKLRRDSLPPEEFLNLFSWLVFTAKVSSFVVVAVAAATFAVVVLDGKRWNGISILNTTSTTSIDPLSWF